MLLLVCRYLFLSSLILPALAYAQSNVQLITSNEVIKLNPHFKIYQETEGQLALSDVQNKLPEFSWQRGKNPNYGFNEQGIWLHTTISNVTENSDWAIELAFTQLEKVDFYVLLNTNY